MNVELDHVFIMTSVDAPEGERLREVGLQEGTANGHPGQGTACRRVAFRNAYVEAAAAAITRVTIGGPVQARSAAVQAAQAAGWLTTQQSPRHVMTLQLDGAGRGIAVDVRPELPLVLQW